MLKIPRNEKGITLVELLAVFVISGIVVLLIIGIHIYTQKQFQTQSDQALKLTDVTIAMKEITKDIRSKDIDYWDEDDQKLKFEDEKYYQLIDETLFKNGSPYIYDIEVFHVEIVEDEVTIEIESESGQQLETTLVVR